MRQLFTILVTVLLLTSLAWAQQSVGPVKVIYPSRMDVSPPLRDMAKSVTEWDPYIQSPREIPNRFDNHREAGGHGGLDEALQSEASTKPVGPTIQNFDGVGNVNGVLPPDTNHDVGLTHVVQMVNLSTAIWDKNGNLQMGPFPGNNFWAGFGGACEMQNAGDPVVLYDQLAGRWLVSQFANPVSAAAEQCVAISTSEDPTGTYRRFAFPTPGNDYPKMGVMEDAYYATVRNFTSTTMDAYAFERSEMINTSGTPQLVVFSMGSLVSRDGYLPSDLDGPTAPPAGAPGIFLGPDDPNNQLDMFELFVDWNNVANSTLVGPTNIPVAAFDTILSGIPQPNTAVGLDNLAFFLMHRLAYRNFGTHQSLVAHHTVDVNDFANHAGIRWYELRNAGPTNGSWTVRQQGTYAPDSHHRWMGSIAMNGNGDIMVGYSVSSSTVFPSIRYTGRQAGDPLNQMTLTEGTIINGAGSQTHPAARWGDYSAMTVDPSDDNTFWYTTEYMPTTGSAPWQTRIASMQATTAPPNMVMSITPVGSTTIPSSGGTLTFDITVTNISNTSVNLDVWNFIVTPNGNEIGPTVGPINVNFPANTTKNFTNRTQNIPGGAPAGSYTLGFRLGGFPGNIFAEDSFGFTKSAGPTSASKTVASLEGWESSWQEGSDVLANSAPESFSLDQNYPNPFNPSTVISYSLPSESHVKLTIYNTLGQEIATLVDQVQSAGSKTVSWNGTDKSGQSVAAGVYLYKLEAGNNVQFKKMTFVK